MIGIGSSVTYSWNITKNYGVGQYGSIAALKGASAPADGTIVSVSGYYAAGDGGGGQFYYDEDAEDDDNGGTIIAPTAGDGRWKRVYSGAVNVKWFGATGDGVTDDTVAFKSAVATVQDGGTVYLPANATYLLSETIVFTKSVVIRGLGSKTDTSLEFSASGTYLADPFKCGFLFLDATTVGVPGYSGSASRSSLTGFTISMKTGGPAGLTGIIICTQIYVNEVDVAYFSKDGFAINASVSAEGVILGNANGTSYTNCLAIRNGGHGFYTYGNNANSCLFIGARTFQNGGWGFFEDGFLGNHYFVCEADDNDTGGYGGYTYSAGNRSTYLGCYCASNHPTTWDLGVYTIRIGSQVTGADNALDGNGISAIYRAGGGELYSTKGLSFADNDTVATNKTGGYFTRIAKGIIEIVARPASLMFSITGIPSTSYTDILVGSVTSMRFPNLDVSQNLKTGRPYVPNGLSFSPAGMIAFGAEAPTSGSYSRGAIVFSDAPTSGGYVGWVCTSTGTPGTWKTFGVIS